MAPAKVAEFTNGAFRVSPVVGSVNAAMAETMKAIDPT